MRFRPTLPSVAKKDGAEAERAEEEEVPPAAIVPQTAGAPQLAPIPEATIAPAAPDDTDADTDSDTNRLIGADDPDSPRPPELDFTPYSPDTLDARHTDSILQALATPETLDKSLRRLDEQARATIEEQGVNVLFLALGMLHYTDSESSDVVLRAPLVMVPVSLTRKSARTGYTIEATDDDPIVNPALAEYLRREYGVTLPDLHSPDSPGEQSDQGDETDDEDSSLHRFYHSVMDVVDDRTSASQPGWSVKTDIFLGLFSFQKLVMFKHLEAHAPEFAGHDMVRQLITREAPPGTVVMGLPEDVRDLELDRDFPPESTAQIVDADSSQLRAIAAISKGYPLVLEGPHCQCGHT